MTLKYWRGLGLGAAMALLPTAVLLLAAGCQSSAPVATVKPPSHPATVAAAFIGSAACRECHPREFSDHSHSNHALTLRLATDESLGKLAPPNGPIPGGEYAVKRAEGGIWFSDGAAQSARMTLAFGSGKTGMTYTGQFTADRLTEYGMSYLPHAARWYVTPGQEGRSDAGIGLDHASGEGKRCVLCHAVTTPASTLEPDSRFFGVGCESCHGPGGEHVALAKAGARDLKMEDMSRRDGEGINALCGRCHRNRDDVSMVTRDAASTQRYQAYGLSMSPCFRKSNGRLTCLTCHNAHTDADTDPRHYEKACLGCHNRQAPGAVACPVNPVDKCLGCHMPKRKIFPGGDVPVEMADHLIWAYRPTHKPPL